MNRTQIRIHQNKIKVLGIIFGLLTIVSALLTAVFQISYWNEISKGDLIFGWSYIAFAIMGAWTYFNRTRMLLTVNGVFCMFSLTISVTTIVDSVRLAPNAGSILFPLLFISLSWFHFSIIKTRRILKSNCEAAQSNKLIQTGPADAGP